MKAILVAEIQQTAAGRRKTEERSMVGTNAEDHVLQRGKGLYQHEMLVDHADPESNGFRGRLDLHRLAVDEDLAAVRLAEPVQDVHQGCLAGAVLPQQSENLALSALETDTVVCQDSRESFCDSLHAQGRSLGL